MKWIDKRVEIKLISDNKFLELTRKILIISKYDCASSLNKLMHVKNWNHIYIFAKNVRYSLLTI